MAPPDNPELLRKWQRVTLDNVDAKWAAPPLNCGLEFASKRQSEMVAVPPYTRKADPELFTNFPPWMVTSGACKNAAAFYADRRLVKLDADMLMVVEEVTFSGKPKDMLLPLNKAS